ncbi:long-chain-fatty-acid--CoA ligase [Heyndrickxia ginsengihumi]|uniref:long-chain-fatty-acid--CoA ligase n=1 Tax=Heyndrickxia ginsengihumi TaxID=363870 RepID=UPI003D21B491
MEKRPWLDKYIVDVETAFTTPESDLYSMLEHTAGKLGENTALIYEDNQITFKQLKTEVDCLAHAWYKLGLKKSERIGVMMENHPDYVRCYYAAMKLGMIVVQINPMYTKRELAEIFTDAELSYLVIQSDYIEKITEFTDFTHVFTSGTPAKNQSFYNIANLIEQSSPSGNKAQIDIKKDVAVIQYTGGTTGKMKGAMLSHFNLFSNLVQSNIIYGDRIQWEHETLLTVIPLYHVYGMTAGMNVGIYTGAANIIVPRFDMNVVLKIIKTYKPSMFPGVPKMFSAFVNYPNIEQCGLDCLKICTSGSAPLPDEIIRKFERITGVTIEEGYGLSEASPVTHRNPPFGIRKIGSIGVPFPKTDCKIVNDEEAELPVNTIGELLIKGPQVMLGYWQKEEETNKAFKHGWFHTGDLAMMDEDGYFYIVGRKKEMMIVSGFNVYPQEVENVLYEYPYVVEAAVIGVPDQERGEIIKAFIVPKEGTTLDINQVKAFCYQRLTRYKVPKIYEIRDGLPRNPVGKILKRLLK